MSDKTKHPDPAPGEEPKQQRGRLIRDPFAVALSDIMDALGTLTDAEKRLMMQVVHTRIPAVDTGEPRM